MSRLRLKGNGLSPEKEWHGNLREGHQERWLDGDRAQGMGKEEQNNNLEDLVTDCYVVLGFGGDNRWRTIQDEHHVSGLSDSERWGGDKSFPEVGLSL